MSTNETEGQTRLRRAKESLAAYQVAEGEARKSLARAVEFTKTAREKYNELFLAEENRESARLRATYNHANEMNPIHRLHSLRMENDSVKFAMDEMRPRFDRIAGRHENGTAPRAVSAFNLFQTPPELAKRLVSLLQLKAGDRVLEPSAGLGRLIREIEPHCPIVAVEIAPQLAGELFKTYQAGVTLKQRDFLTCDYHDLGLFDAVAMNPPFHMRADIHHILHAHTFLKPGGNLAALCMDTPHREKALRHLCTTWEQIPAGAFKSEGTGIAAVLLTMQN